MKIQDIGNLPIHLHQLNYLLEVNSLKGNITRYKRFLIKYHEDIYTYLYKKTFSTGQ